MAVEIEKKDVVWNYLGTIASLGSNLVMVPILMFFLDSDLLGLWQIFTSIGAIALLLDFGLTPTLARNIAYVWSGAQVLIEFGVHKTEEQPVNYELLLIVIKVCKYIYLIIAVLSFALLSVCGSLYINHISEAIGGQLYILAWGIYVIAIFMNLYYYYYSSILIGVGGIAENNKAKVIASIVQIVLCTVLLIFRASILAPALAYLLYGVLYRGLAKRYFYEYSNIGDNLEKINIKVKLNVIKKIFFIIWHNAWRDGLVSLSNYLITQANTIICSLFFNLEQVGIYSLSLQFVTAIGLLSSVPYSTYQPKIQSAYLNNNMDTIKKIMSIVVTLYCGFFVVGMVGLIFVGIPILHIIKPNYVFNTSTLGIMGIYMFLQKRYSLYTSYISNTNKVPYVKAFLFSSMLSVVLSYILCAKTSLGIWGIVLGQLISQSLYNNWYWPHSVKKQLKLDTIQMLKTTNMELLYFIKNVC